MESKFLFATRGDRIAVQGGGAGRIKDLLWERVVIKRLSITLLRQTDKTDNVNYILFLVSLHAR